MNTTIIYKYPLEPIDAQAITLPKNAKFLCIQIQHNIPCAWFIVDPKEEMEEITLITYGTGHTGVCMQNYLGTYQMYSGALIYHVFKQ